VSTQPPTTRKSLTPENLAELGRARLRELCQVLLAEQGLRVTRVQPRATTDDLYVAPVPLWRPRTSVLRVAHRQLEAHDVRDLAEVVRAHPLADGVLVEGAPGNATLPLDDAVQVLRADEVVRRIRNSPLVEWADGQPQTAMMRLALALDLNEIAPALDPVGLRWLPTLSLNSLPPELDAHGTANDLFEDITFRILTTSLRFGGRRLGARRRGERVPDAVLRWQENGEGVAAVLDCKAAQYGYRMKIDDHRALTEYFGQLQGQEAAAGFRLRYILVVSSEFDGEPGDTHPFHGRATAIAAEAHGAKLVYLRASDLVQLVLAVERDRADPAEREGVAWSQLFDIGMPESRQVAAMWPPGGGTSGNV
jgi:hypothetical protein